MDYNSPFSDFEGGAIAPPRGESYDRSTYPAGWDDGIKAAVAERYPAKSDNQRILDAFEEDWSKSNNRYDGLLSVGVSPQEAAARTLQPQVAKWASFAPIMRNMTSQSRFKPEQDWKIVHAADGIFRVNQRTGEREVVHETTPKPGPDAFETLTYPGTDSVPGVEGTLGTPAIKKSFLGIDSLWPDQPEVPSVPAVPGIEGKPKRTVRVPRMEAFDNSFREGPQPASPSRKSEVTHKLKNGRMAVFDATTKRFLRYANTNQ